MKNTEISSVRIVPPEGVRSFAWHRNHHFVELEDRDGNRTKLDAGGVIIGICDMCQARLIAFSHSGAMACTHCLSTNVKWAWMKPQLAFIPEQESQFMGWAAAHGTDEIVKK